MSREGCGRVSVMKMTGLVRSYTLECNYNTGRIVNLLPPCVRDYARMAINVAYAVPPKYTPLVFEDVRFPAFLTVHEFSVKLKQRNFDVAFRTRSSTKNIRIK